MAIPKMPMRDLGPGLAVFGVTELGRNQSVKFGHTCNVSPVTNAAHGSTPVNRIGAGGAAQVELMLSESSLAVLGAMLPGGTVTGDELIVKNAVGKDMRELAKTLIIKPLDSDAVVADEKQWLHLALATPIPEFEWTYDAESQRVAKVLFDAYPVDAADIAVGGELYNSGSPLWPVGGLWSVGLGQ